MVAGAAPTSNYATSNQLSSRGPGSSPSESFLKFALPEAPAGMALSGAVLSVRTSTDPTAGSADVHTFSVISAAWSEGTLTWNNRPTEAGSPVGTLSGATAVNTVYSSTWDAAVLQSRLGQTVSVKLSSVGADNLRLHSQNATSATNRPVLTLTYTPIG